MNLRSKVLDYFDIIRNDANDPQRIDRISALLKTKKFEDTQAYSTKMARIINALFQSMPELKNYEKLYPLYCYCAELPKVSKVKKIPKSPTPR
jgi:hypothetical protein